MSIETDAQKDLSLNPEDAENVIGGNRKKKAKQAVHQAAAHAGPNINIQGPVTATSTPPVDDCADDPAAVTTSDTAATGA